MKRNTTRPRTIEKNLFDIGLAIALFVALIFMCKTCSNQPEPAYTIEDRHQMQEMIDYQTSQGRTNIRVR